MKIRAINLYVATNYMTLPNQLERKIKVLRNFELLTLAFKTFNTSDFWHRNYINGDA